MPLLSLILVIVVIGVVLYLINTFIPMDANVKKVLNIAVIVILCIWLLQLIVPLGNLPSVRIGR